MNVDVRCSSFEELSSSNSGTILSVQSHQSIKFSHNIVFKVSSSISPGCLYTINSNIIEILHCFFECCYSTGGNEKYGQILYSLSTNAVCSSLSSSYCSPLSQTYGDSIFRIEDSTLDADNINASYSYDKEIGSASFSFDQSNDHIFMKYLNVIHTCTFTSLEIMSRIKDGCECTCYYSNFINSSKNINSVLSIGYHIIIDTCVFIEYSPIRVTRYPEFTEFRKCISDTKVTDISITYEEKPLTIYFDINVKEKCNLITINFKLKKNTIRITLIFIFIMFDL